MQILAPVVLIIAIGWGLLRTGFLSSPALADINRLTYWVGLPALLIERISSATPALGSVGGMLIVLAGTAVASMVLAALIAGFWGMPGRSGVTFIHGTFRGNLTFVGLPVVIYAFAGSPDAAAVESAALVAFVPMVILYNVTAVVLMQLPGGWQPVATLQRVGRGLLTNPILLSTLVGMTLALLDWELPLLAERTFSALGQMALPLALLGIGGGLYTTRLRGRRQWALSAAVLKTTAGPLIGALLGVWVGLSAEEMRLVLIFLACPTAAASFVLVQQMDGDVALIASTIMLSHLFALPAMLLVLALTA